MAALHVVVAVMVVITCPIVVEAAALRPRSASATPCSSRAKDGSLAALQAQRARGIFY